MNRSLPSCQSYRLAASLVCVGMLFTFLVPAAQAGRRSKKVKEQDYKQYYDQIASVDQTAHTVTVATMVKEIPVAGTTTGKTKEKPDTQEKVTTYNVTTSSVIEVNGQKSNLAALSQGMKVSVTKGMDEHVVSRLEVKQ